MITSLAVNVWGVSAVVLTLMQGGGGRLGFLYVSHWFPVLVSEQYHYAYRNGIRHITWEAATFIGGHASQICRWCDIMDFEHDATDP